MTTGLAATLAAPGHGAHRERTKEAGIALPGHLGAHGHRFEDGSGRRPRPRAAALRAPQPGRRPEDALREAAALVRVPCLGAVQ